MLFYIRPYNYQRIRHYNYLHNYPHKSAHNLLCRYHSTLPYNYICALQSLH